MNEEMRVKYLFVNLKYPHYIALQFFCFASLIIGTIALFLLFRDHSAAILRSLWIIAAIGVILEIYETTFAIRKAKKKYEDQQHAESVN